MENRERQEVATIPLAYHELCLDREKAEKRLVIIAWAVSLVAVVALFVFLWLQYDYIGYEEVQQTGVYVLSDSAENVIAADADADQIIDLLRGEPDGENSSEDSPLS